MTSTPPDLDELDPEFAPDRTGCVFKWAVFLFLLAMVAAIFVVVFYGGQLKLDDPATTDRVSRPKEFSDLISGGDVEELRQHSIEIRAGLQRQPGSVLVELAEKRQAIADRLEAISDDPEILAFAYVSRLESLWLLNELRLNNNLPRDDVARELLELSKAEENSSDPEIRWKAHLGLVIYQVTEFVAGSGDLEACREQIDRSLPVVMEHPQGAGSVAAVIDLLFKSRDGKGRRALGMQMVELLYGSELKPNRALANATLARIFNERFQFNEMIRRLSLGDEKTVEEVRAAVKAVAEAEFVPPATWLRVLQAVDALHRVGRSGEISEMAAQLESSVGRISDPGQQGRFAALSQSLKQRASRLGAPLRLEGVDRGGRRFGPEEFAGTLTVVLYFVEGRPRSDEARKLLAEYRTWEQRGIRRLAIAMEADDSPSEEPQPTRSPGSDDEGLQIAEWEQVSADLREFPIGTLPYLLLIDGNGVIVELNIEPGTLRTVLEKHLADVDPGLE